MTWWPLIALVGAVVVPSSASADEPPAAPAAELPATPGCDSGAEAKPAVADGPERAVPAIADGHDRAIPADAEAETAAGEADTAAGEGEIRERAVGDESATHYSGDLSDAELERRWVEDLPSLGTISVGFAEAGRLINGVQLPSGAAWEVLAPEYTWGAQETIDDIELAARAVRERFPDAPPLLVNHISKRDGGWLRPHKSHQSGRDVDLGLYTRSVVGTGGRQTDVFDPAENWALVRALVTQTDVVAILVDRRLSQSIYAAAVAAGEDRAWLDSIFLGSAPLVQHARGHRDHFHVRFFAPRSQEIGRRVQPLLAKRPDENRVAVRVRSGDTLGHLALRYGSTVSLIQSANGMRGSFLQVGRTLSIPLRGPCTLCPLPPVVVVPPRRLPPEATSASVEVMPGSSGVAADVDTTPEAGAGVAARDSRPAAPVP